MSFTVFISILYILSEQEDFHLHAYSTIYKGKKAPVTLNQECDHTDLSSATDVTAHGMANPVYDPVHPNNDESKYDVFFVITVTTSLCKLANLTFSINMYACGLSGYMYIHITAPKCIVYKCKEFLETSC